jgi:anti-sigma B factor antagonist
METVFDIREGRGIVQLHGPLTAASADGFRERFLRWMEDAATVRDVVIDLAEAEFLDSAGLGALVALLKRVTERGGDLKLARMPRKVRMIFEITRAHRIFEIFETVEEALESFA